MPSWTAPRTWVAGNVLTAAQLNTDVRDNVGYLKDSPSLAAPTITTGATFSGAAPSTPTAKTVYSDALISAWCVVTFSGGTPAIGSDFNVASLTDNGTGDVTVTFATALGVSTYVAMVQLTSGIDGYEWAYPSNAATGSVKVLIGRDVSAADKNFHLLVVGGK